MKNLLLSSFVCVVLLSCNYGHYHKLQIINSNPVVLQSIFKDSFNSFLFKTNIHLYTKDFSGLLITKQTTPKNYRIVFTTEMGMTLFDFEFKDTSFTVHYCIDQFNKPIILKTIKKDIEILLMNDLQTKTMTNLTDKKNIYSIIKTPNDVAYNYYFIQNESKRLVKIEHAGKRKKKTSYLLDQYSANFPHHISIRHHDFNLQIELNLLEK